MQRADVYVGRGDQCPFGQWSTDEHGPGLVLKPTGWLSNSLHILEHVAVRRCNTTPGSQIKIFFFELAPQFLILDGGKRKSDEEEK